MTRRTFLKSLPHTQVGAHQKLDELVKAVEKMETAFGSPQSVAYKREGPPNMESSEVWGELRLLMTDTPRGVCLSCLGKMQPGNVFSGPVERDYSIRPSICEKCGNLFGGPFPD
jgi:hypothetical protein